MSNTAFDEARRVIGAYGTEQQRMPEQRGKKSNELAVIQINSVPSALKALDKLELEIKRASTAEVLTALANIAAGLQRRWKLVKDVADRAGSCWVTAEVKLGEEKKKIGKAVGTRANFRGVKVGRGRGKGGGKGSSAGSAIVATPAERTPTTADLGLDPKLAARAAKLFDMGEQERKRLEGELVAKNKPVSPHGILSAKRAETKTNKKRTLATATFSASGPFDVVVIDPPWPMQKIDREERPNQDAFDYPTMTVDELAAFWKRDMARKIKADCHLFIWTTQKFLPVAIKFLDTITFRYVLTMVWHKPGGFQPVDLPQYNCEFVLYARQGAPVFVDTKQFDCCFSAPRRQHSRKPDLFYDTIRRVTGGSRVDVFSREERDGFATYGNERGKFSAVA
jgi:N6-adenosine-specific RNA methylase IME4